MKILLFGVLSDVVKAQYIEITHVSTTDELIKYLEDKFPDFKKYNYQIALNHKKTNGNLHINITDEIALLPPFAGG